MILVRPTPGKRIPGKAGRVPVQKFSNDVIMVRGLILCCLARNIIFVHLASGEYPFADPPGF
jgi:hypothetical protein